MKRALLFSSSSLFLLLLCSAPVAFAAEASQPAAPRINHLAFHVRDLKVSTQFYQTVIGLETISEPFRDGRHTWFLIGPKTHLHLIAGAGEAPPRSKQNHLCFSVPSVDAFVARLKQANVSFENLVGEKSAVTTRPDGVKQIYFQDPDGNWLEVNDAKS